MKRRTKIIATIGPASRSRERIRGLLEAGVNVARLNFSHGDHSVHAETITLLREEAGKLQHSLAILQDLQGPKIRTGKLAADSVELQAGQTLTLTTQDVIGDASRVSIDYPDLPQRLTPGSRILLSDGNMELLVQRCDPEAIYTEVVLGGTLKSRQGVNLPGTALNIDGFTEKDRQDLAFGLSQGVDAVAMSFVRSAADVARVRQEIDRIKPGGAGVVIIAKLERPEALDNLDSIVSAADGVMVARGDLGVELPPEDVPIAQKRIITSANRKGRFVVTATQMLESMLNNPRPTRAEASDVANAIFDGTDAVMLSGETAVGRYPVKAVSMMDAIVRRAESGLAVWGHWEGLQDTEDDLGDAVYLSQAASALAKDRNVAAIAVFTKTGSTALLMSKARPAVPILGFTADERTYRRMAMFWGVVPHLVPWAESMEHMLQQVESRLLAHTPVEPGQQVVLICGFPIDRVRPSNLVLLHTVGAGS